MIDEFQPTDIMFFDKVHLNMKRGLPDTVKHLRIAFGIVNPSKRQLPQVSLVNQKTPTTGPTPHYRNSAVALNFAPFRGPPVPPPWISQQPVPPPPWLFPFVNWRDPWAVPPPPTQPPKCIVDAAKKHDLIDIILIT